MKVLGIEVPLNADQVDQLVQQIKLSYPEVYESIYSQGFNDALIDEPETCQDEVCCPYCGNEFDSHCFNCDPYPN